jgi:hypothetical protein
MKTCVKKSLALPVLTTGSGLITARQVLPQLFTVLHSFACRKCAWSTGLSDFVGQHPHTTVRDVGCRKH